MRVHAGRLIVSFFALGLLFPSVTAHAQIPNSTADVAPTEASATQRGSRIHINSSNSVRINYGQPRWNKDPEQIDTATVLMREGVSGRIVQIQLNETAPDSSVFSGLYSINFRNMDKLATEFYIPSQDMMAQKDGLLKVTKLIQEKKIQRNPFILRRLTTGEQTIEIFDTKDQAREAMKTYRAEQLVMLQNQKPTKFPSDQDLDTERLAKAQVERQQAARAQSERARLAQVEAARLADLIEKQKQMSEAQNAERRQQAAAAGEEGLALYQSEDYAGARAKFDQAVNLDPDNRAFYFQYGVTLYKVGDYGHALVFLNMATGSKVNPAEKNYFAALTHLKLKENDAALASLDQVIATKDPVLAPSSQFYKGSIYYEQENFDQAQSSFQAVLDSSNDPKLDERAESYIEQILRARQAADERKHKWNISGAVGEMYDSNVLLSPDSQRDSGIATGAGGWRTLLSGSARYRPVYDDKKEFAAQLDVLTLYTINTSFQVDQTLRNTDPTVVTLTLPYTSKGTWFSRAHKLDIIPGFETTVMSIEDNVQKAIIQSPLLSFSNLLVMNDNWFNTITLDTRDDISKLSTSTGDDDASALKFRLGTTNLVFLNEKKDRILLPEFALTTNQAVGKNASYNRADVAAGYLIPTPYATTTNFKLGYFYLNYPSKSPAPRTDSSYTATFGVSKKLTDIWNAGFLGSYNINRSNEDANTYSKFTALLTLSAAYGF